MDAFIRRRFGGPGLYGTPQQGWWPQLRMMLLCYGGVMLLVLIALAASGRLEEAVPPVLAATSGLASYAVCLPIAVQVRARRARLTAAASQTCSTETDSSARPPSPPSG